MALSEDAGKEIWATRVGGRHDDEYGGPRGTPTVDGALLYVAGHRRRRGLSGNGDRQERWRRSLTRDFGGRMTRPGCSRNRRSSTATAWSSRPAVAEGRDRRARQDHRQGHLARHAGSIGRQRRRRRRLFVDRHFERRRREAVRAARGTRRDRRARLDGWFMWGNNHVANDIANISDAGGQRRLRLRVHRLSDRRAVLLQLAATATDASTRRRSTFSNAGTISGSPRRHSCSSTASSTAATATTTGFRSRWNWRRAGCCGSGARRGLRFGRRHRRRRPSVLPVSERDDGADCRQPEAVPLKSSFAIPNVRNPSWSHPVVTGGRLYLREQDALHVYST